MNGWIDRLLAQTSPLSHSSSTTPADSCAQQSPVRRAAASLPPRMRARARLFPPSQLACMRSKNGIPRSQLPSNNNPFEAQFAWQRDSWDTWRGRVRENEVPRRRWIELDWVGFIKPKALWKQKNLWKQVEVDEIRKKIKKTLNKVMF